MSSDRSGMTLVELMLALSLTGLTFTLGFGVLRGVEASHDQITTAVRDWDAAMEGRRMLRDLLTRADVHGTDAAPFHGASRTLSFDSWCDGSGSALAPCRVHITIVRGTTGASVRAEWGRGHAALAEVSSEAHFAFRDMHEAGPIWHEQWGMSLRRPESVGLVDGVDTLLLPVGAAR